MSKENKQSRETVTLILSLGKERFQVEKQKLIDKSQYFAALFSANYLESHQVEHIINYNVSSNVLKNFLDWIDNGKIASTLDFDSEKFNHLMTLLELSVLFVADNLMKEISKELEEHFMSPRNIINIWLLAQDLNINTLRDLSLSVCLDRFEELPRCLILKLSKENFIKLIGNNNIRSDVPSLLDIMREWMKYNHNFTISPDILNNKKIDILYGIISCGDNYNEQFIHCWNGKKFFELMSFKYPPEIIEQCFSSGKILEGVQFAVRRYDLYLCGGEYGIGSGKFNKNVWRYSLISKNWFLVTTMTERRHMITVFLENKLVLMGGVGKYRQKLTTVDIYDIHTGNWTSNIKISWLFTSVPEHFVIHDKLIITQFIPTLYIFTLYGNIRQINFCQTVSDFKVIQNKPMLTFMTKPCYIDIIDQDEMVLKVITDTCNMEDCKKDKPHLHIKADEHYTLYEMFEEHELFLTLFRNEKEKPILLLYTESLKYKNLHKLRDVKILHMHSVPIEYPRKFRSLVSEISKSTGFFVLNDPAYLHATNSSNM